LLKISQVKILDDRAFFADEITVLPDSWLYIHPVSYVPEKIKITCPVPEDLTKRCFYHPGIDDHENNGSRGIAEIGRPGGPDASEPWNEEQVQYEVDNQCRHKGIDGDLRFPHAGKPAVEYPETCKDKYARKHNLDHDHALSEFITEDQRNEDRGNEKDTKTSEQSD